MEKVKRDTTKDLFNAVLQLVKDNGYYDKAELIMDYHLPNISESHIREDIELSSYEFDFYACAQFGGSEGIYIDVWLSGKYTENEIKVYNHGTGQVEKETRRSIGTFKTLKDDLGAMMIMGELCGALTYYANQYVNQNIERYTPVKELEQQRRYNSSSEARLHYITEIAKISPFISHCEVCADKACRGKQDGCVKGITRYMLSEVGNHCSMNRYEKDSRNKYFDFLDGKYGAGEDNFGEYAIVLMRDFPDLTIYQAIGYVFVWLCTRKQDFTFVQAAAEVEGAEVEGTETK